MGQCRCRAQKGPDTDEEQGEDQNQAAVRSWPAAVAVAGTRDQSVLWPMTTSALPLTAAPSWACWPRSVVASRSATSASATAAPARRARAHRPRPMFLPWPARAKRLLKQRRDAARCVHGPQADCNAECRGCGLCRLRPRGAATVPVVAVIATGLVSGSILVSVSVLVLVLEVMLGLVAEPGCGAGAGSDAAG